MVEEIDYGEIFAYNCEIIDDVCGDLVKSISNNTCTAHEVDGSTLMITVAVLRILNVLYPVADRAKLMGLTSDKIPEPVFFDRDNPKWDFKPWFQEKFARVYEACFRLAENVDGHDKKHNILEDLNTLKAYNTAIYDMIKSGRIAIRDILLNDDEG